MTVSEIAAGWYKDPAEPTTQRYWTGEEWIGEPLPVGDTPPAGPPPGAAPTASAAPRTVTPVAPTTPAAPTAAGSPAAPERQYHRGGPAGRITRPAAALGACSARPDRLARTTGPARPGSWPGQAGQPGHGG